MEDKKGIGLTEEGQVNLSEIDQKGWFADSQDTARFCMAYAIRAGVAPGTSQGAETRWAGGLFDSTGEMRAVVEALFPDYPTPMRLMEHFVHEGLRMVARRVRSEGAGPVELMSEPSRDVRSR